MAKLDDMMGAMGGMKSASEAPADEPAPAKKQGPGELSEEEMAHAEDMGFNADQAAALKRFIRSCMAAEEADEYEDEAAPAVDAEMGDL